MRLNYAIIFVSDMSQSVKFYHDVLGLALGFESPEWTEFTGEDGTIALHVSDTPNPQTPDHTANPAGSCIPGLCVPDLDAFHQRMIKHNVTCIQEPNETVGVRLAQYLDPDGLEFSVSEVKSHS
jgi:catechol 2,3-dioxygenase-like lactoylglutathione lyase family enzyme